MVGYMVEQSIASVCLLTEILTEMAACGEDQGLMRAQSMDCGKPTRAQEQAICTQKGLYHATVSPQSKASQYMITLTPDRHSLIRAQFIL